MNVFLQYPILIVLAYILAGIVTGLWSQTIAQGRGYEPKWFAAGFFLSLLGVLIAAGLPLRESAKTAAAKPVAAPAPAAPVAAADNNDLIAVLAAAVAMLGEQEGRTYVLKAFRPTNAASTAWARAGR